MAIDSNAQLALIAKAKMVFENSPDVFLSFPALTPLSYTPDQLNFPAIPSTSQQSQMLEEFATLVNTIPLNVVFDSGNGARLWDVYGNVLNVLEDGGDEVQLAQANMPAQQSSELQQAQALLYTQTGDGLQAPSAQYVSYLQFQSAWNQATQNYKTQEITADNSTDPVVQSQWQNTTEPALRAAVQSAMDDWTNNGDKTAIEQALDVVASSATTQSPQAIWHSWKSSFQPGIDFLTDPTSGAPFALTAFSPSNVTSQADWPTFTLSGSEITQLVSQAPKELVNIFGTTTGTSSVSSLSFQFCSVALNRPWFKPALFDARFWRFVDPTMQLSDSQNPANGLLPAYITGLVFIRNIVVTTVTPDGTAQHTSVPNIPPLNHHTVLDPIFLCGTTGGMHPALSVPPPNPPEAATRLRVIPTMETPASMHPASIPAAAQAPVTSVTAPTSYRAPAAFALRTMVMPPDQAMLSNAAIASRLSCITYAAPAPATAVSTSTTATPSNTVSILAFICRRTPLSPNPDPTLPW